MTTASLSFAAMAALVALASPPPAGRTVFVVNESRSLPRGLYLRTNDPVAPGRIVVVRPPPKAAAYLMRLGAGPRARLLKRVAARGGETVCGRGGRLAWPRGAAAALRRDRQRRPLAAWAGCRRLAPDELLVMGDTPTSFDSRYFGPVRLREVEGVYREVLRW